ncbi:Gfo/Idh/MocA family oxidoreductase [Pokkaliibacter sp. CJK22405]|uniref:Gfo/Idh/MocA family protein n=1 Tax=Pokkaliibacter sp. CJK22405 TaxID=3384615 RepID=UPI003984B199
MLNVGIVGTGMSAKVFHIPLLSSNPLFSIHSQFGRSLNQADSSPWKLYSDFEAFLADPTLELVVITTPNTLHASMAIQALNAGKHVLVEKPFCLSDTEADNIFAAAKNANKTVCAFQNRRFDNDFLTLQKLIKEGSLGDLSMIESRFDRFRPETQQRWREEDQPGAGYWWDLGPHLADQSLQLFGKPTAITADLRSIRPDSKACDYFQVTLHYPNQLSVRLGATCHNAESPTLRYRAEGSKGSFVKYGLDPQEDRLKADGIFLNGDTGIEDSAHWGTLFTSEGKSLDIPTLEGSYQHFYKKLHDAIKSNAALPVSETEIRDALHLILLAEKSSRERKTLDWNDSAY